MNKASTRTAMTITTSFRLVESSILPNTQYQSIPDFLNILSSNPYKAVYLQLYIRDIMQKMVHLPLRIEQSVIDSIDEIVRQNSAYKSRSDYIRKTLQKYIEKDRKMKEMLDQTAKEIAAIIVKRGAKPGLMTREEKIKIADEFLKEKELHY